MGYRSDVTAMMRFKDKDTARKFVSLVKLKCPKEGKFNEVDALADYTIMTHDTSDLVDFIMVEEGVKWYSSYDEVASHERLWDLIDEFVPQDAQLRALRIGEEHEDIECITGGSYDFELDYELYVTRSIERPTVRDGGPSLNELMESDNG
jgi:hypothetical protein